MQTHAHCGRGTLSPRTSHRVRYYHSHKSNKSTPKWTPLVTVQSVWSSRELDMYVKSVWSLHAAYSILYGYNRTAAWWLGLDCASLLREPSALPHLSLSTAQSTNSWHCSGAAYLRTTRCSLTTLDLVRVQFLQRLTADGRAASVPTSEDSEASQGRFGSAVDSALIRRQFTSGQ
jgi:hypothetical protein